MPTGEPVGQDTPIRARGPRASGERRTVWLRWVEVQTTAVQPSGWRLMVPLVALNEAPDAPPLIATVDRERARIHLLCSAPHDKLGELVGDLSVDDVWVLQAAVQRLVAA